MSDSIFLLSESFQVEQGHPGFSQCNETLLEKEADKYCSLPFDEIMMTMDKETWCDWGQVIRWALVFALNASDWKSNFFLGKMLLPLLCVAPVRLSFYIFHEYRYEFRSVWSIVWSCIETVHVYIWDLQQHCFYACLSSTPSVVWLIIWQQTVIPVMFSFIHFTAASVVMPPLEPIYKCIYNWVIYFLLVTRMHY